MAVLVTWALLVTLLLGGSSAASGQGGQGGPLEKLYQNHSNSVFEEWSSDVHVESPQLHIVPTKIAHLPDDEAARLPRSDYHPQSKSAADNRLFFDPALLLNLTSKLTNGILLNSTDTGLNITFNINPTNLTLTVTPIPSGPNIFNPFNVPIPLKGTTVTLPITDAFALLNITGPVGTALAGLLIPVSPLTWLIPPPPFPLGLPGIFPGGFPGGFLGGFPGGFPGGHQENHHHHHRPTTTIVKTVVVTSTSVRRSYLTETSTRIFTLPKVSYSKVVIPSTSTSTIVVPSYETVIVVFTMMSTSTVIVPEYETKLPVYPRPHPHPPPHHYPPPPPHHRPHHHHGHNPLYPHEKQESERL